MGQGNAVAPPWLPIDMKPKIFVDGSSALRKRVKQVMKRNA